MTMGNYILSYLNQIIFMTGTISQNVFIPGFSTLINNLSMSFSESKSN